MAQTTISDLPADILYNIFPYLTAAEFVRFTSSQKALLAYRDDTAFWHVLTRQTFRIPPQPLLQGQRWRSLYRKLLTQTRLYTWGSNKVGNLGTHGDLPNPRTLPPIAPRISRRPRLRVYQKHLPTEVIFGEDVGIVADVQCGGWSTTILNSLGALFIFGIIDGTSYHRNESALRRLTFPTTYPLVTKERYEPSTAIRQYSTGRATVLGLSDDRKVWMWTQDTALLIKPAHVDIEEHRVTKVVAGWDRSSMYVVDIGIVYWASVSDSPILQGGRQEALAIADGIRIETVTIPSTGHRRRSNGRSLDDSLDARIGEVTNHIVLEEFIVFTTDLNKVFCYPTAFPVPAIGISEPIELTTFFDPDPSVSFKICNLQGSFTNFAVFTESGFVFTATKAFLRSFHEASKSSTRESKDSLPRPALVPSLQGKSVISLAFGDWHFHALHANGTVSSYGHEPQGCGALGLGDRVISPLRGLIEGDGATTLPDGQGRTVWFEPLMAIWLEGMTVAATTEEAKLRFDMLKSGHPGAREAFTNYFEQEGARWEQDITDEGEMGGYFVLKVAAAGWSSAALVLVDEDKVERARKAHIVPPPPPSPALPSAPSLAHSTRSDKAINSPSEQLANTIYAVYDWVWELGRWFLGLTARDIARNATSKETSHDDADGEEASESVVYTWSKDPFPRLRLPDGEEMPGEIPLTETGG